MESSNIIEQLKKQIDKQKEEINYLKESIRELESEKTSFSEIRSKILKNESADFKKNLQKYLNENDKVNIFAKLLIESLEMEILLMILKNIALIKKIL